MALYLFRRAIIFFRWLAASGVALLQSPVMARESCQIWNSISFFAVCIWFVSLVALRAATEKTLNDGFIPVKKNLIFLSLFFYPNLFDAGNPRDYKHSAARNQTKPTMTTPTRLPLPKGRLNMRHRQMRGVWQIFAGNTYITGASGDSPDMAAQELADQYEVAAGTPITVHGFREPSTKPTPEPSL